MNDADKKAFEAACNALYAWGYSEQFSMALWQTALEYARSQAGEPVAWRHSLTHCLFETEDEIDLADGDEYAEPLYLAPPAAQINQQMREALKDIAATGYSNIDRDKARAALAATQMRGDA